MQVRLTRPWVMPRFGRAPVSASVSYDPFQSALYTLLGAGPADEVLIPVNPRCSREEWVKAFGELGCQVRCHDLDPDLLVVRRR